MKELKVKSFVVILTLLLGFSCVGICLAGPTYSGDLTSADDGILGNNGWTDDPTEPITLNWQVTLQDTGTYAGLWYYEYTFDIGENQGALSHLVIEVSDNVEFEEILGESYAIESDGPKVYEYEPFGSSGDSYSLFGIKAEGFSEDTSWIFSFYTARSPVWGDFYAKDGSVGGFAWNAGFLLDDPLVAPADGSVQNHILVPDTTIIPAPGAFLLASIGLITVSRIRRRML